MCGIVVVVGVLGDDATLRVACVGLAVILVAGAGVAWKTAAK
ncbi:hypothetical protein [Streptomyces sp. NPDC008122]